MTTRAVDFDIRLADVTVFLAVRSQLSVTAAARALGLSASAVSKAISRLERELGVNLLSRSGRGVALTSSAERLVPLLEEASKSLRAARQGVNHQRGLTVVAPSFIVAAVTPALASHMPTLRFRALQMSNQVVMATASQRQFEIALLTATEPKLPSSWQMVPMGALQWGLFASPKVARSLGGRPSIQALKAIPFVTPMSLKQGQWVTSDDGCPLGVDERLIGHETETAVVGLELAACCDQLIFAPRIAALSYLQDRSLKEIAVTGWDVQHQITLAVDVDRVSSPEFKTIQNIVSGVIAKALR